VNLQARELRYFLALSETLSFTEAAKPCEISQPALTRAIKGLEDRLGGRPLVHREKGFTHLSALGLAMKPYFESVLNELQNAKEEARIYREQSVIKFFETRRGPA
jgi:DNA-binding transcriptional LysR family regulator